MKIEPSLFKFSHGWEQWVASLRFDNTLSITLTWKVIA